MLSTPLWRQYNVARTTKLSFLTNLKLGLRPVATALMLCSQVQSKSRSRLSPPPSTGCGFLRSEATTFAPHTETIPCSQNCLHEECLGKAENLGVATQRASIAKVRRARKPLSAELLDVQQARLFFSVARYALEQCESL